VPEDALIGEMYYGPEPVNGDILITNSSPSWLFANTGLTIGSTLPGLLGYEVDAYAVDGTTPADTQVVAHSPYTFGGATYYGDMTVYTSTSGSTVFGFGTLQWIWGLANISPWGNSLLVNAAAQQITRNVLNQLILTSRSRLAYTVVSPTNGTIVSSPVSIAISTTFSAINDWWNDLVVDGVPTGLTDTGHYQQIFWDPSTLPSGAHTLTVRARQQSTGAIVSETSVSVTSLSVANQ
jgi:hypothetical protein